MKTCSPCTRGGLIALASVLMAGCALTPLEPIDTAAMRTAAQTTVPEPSTVTDLAPIPLLSRISTPTPQPILDDEGDETLFSFQAENMPIGQALRLFARAYGLNILVAENVTATITADFVDLPFDEAMQSLLDIHGYYWFRNGGLIHVRSEETRIFEIDYIRLVRTGTGSSQAQVSSTASTESGAADAGATAGTISIQQTDTVSFWEELEAQLALLVSDSGRLVVNRLAGTIQITDQHRTVEEIASYLDQIERSIYRQVDLEIKIVEIALADDLSVGVDWSKVINSAAPSSGTEFVITNTVSAPAGGIGALPSSLLLNSFDDDSTSTLDGVLTALSEQGEVQVVSQPHIRTLNNQSALIKVGTDRTFFRKEQVTDATSAGSQTFSTDVPQVVTEGIVLSITPQISADGWITMDVSPVVTRVSSVSEVTDPSGNVQSTAPNLDISQASSLVRAMSGQTIIIGGLIQTQESYTSRGVPGLKQIPGVGRIFSGTYRADQRKELIMFLTPRVVDPVIPVAAVQQ